MNRAWVDIPAPQFVAFMRSGGAQQVRACQSGHVRALISYEPSGGGGYRWHLSVSRADRYPSWDEVADARYDLIPDGCDMAMLLPPRADYTNHSPFVLHLHEVRDPHMTNDRGMGMARTHEDGSHAS